MHSPVTMLVSRIMTENALPTGGNGDFTAVSPDDECVHKVIKLLEQIARHQRQRKTEQSAENRTMGQVNIHNKGILLSLHRIV